MNNPTEKQIKKFWEYFGFVSRGRSYTGKILLVAPDELEWFDECVKDVDAGGYTRMPEKDRHYSPLPITLNNLSRYAIPKLDSFELEYDYRMSTEERSAHGQIITHSDYIYTALAILGVNTASAEDKDPALASFWAIFQVIRLARR